MTSWLPFALLIVFVVLLIAMPWRRPHPNHLFVFRLAESLPAANEKSRADFTVVSSSCNGPLTIPDYKSTRRIVNR